MTQTTATETVHASLTLPPSCPPLSVENIHPESLDVYLTLLAAYGFRLTAPQFLGLSIAVRTDIITTLSHWVEETLQCQRGHSLAETERTEVPACLRDFEQVDSRGARMAQRMARDCAHHSPSEMSPRNPFPPASLLATIWIQAYRHAQQAPDKAESTVASGAPFALAQPAGPGLSPAAPDAAERHSGTDHTGDDIDTDDIDDDDTDDDDTDDACRVAQREMQGTSPLTIAEALDSLTDTLQAAAAILARPDMQAGLGFIRDLAHEAEQLRATISSVLPPRPTPSTRMLAELDFISCSQTLLVERWAQALQSWVRQTYDCEELPGQGTTCQLLEQALLTATHVDLLNVKAMIEQMGQASDPADLAADALEAFTDKLALKYQHELEQESLDLYEDHPLWPDQNAADVLDEQELLAELFEDSHIDEWDACDQLSPDFDLFDLRNDFEN